MKVVIFLILVVFVFSTRVGFAAGPAVLIEDKDTPVAVGTIESTDTATSDWNSPTVHQSPSSSGSSRDWQDRSKPISQGRSIMEIYENQEFKNFDQLRKKRRVGAGAVLGGSIGMMGLQLELNITEVLSGLLQFGGGPQYSSFGFLGRYNGTEIGNYPIVPIFSAGVSSWSGRGDGSLEKSNPSYLASKYLSQEERKTGRFSKAFLVGGAGLQFNQLFGPLTGLSAFASVDLVVDLIEVSPTPVGSVGTTFYF